MSVTGLPAWLMWLTVNLWYLIGVQNRLLVVIRWAFGLFTRSRDAGLITGPSVPAGRTARRNLR